MLISIIIPTYKRIKILERVLQSIFDSRDGFECEIIVVNDDKLFNIESYTFLIENQISIKKINNTKSGAASARNAGAEVAQGEILLFIDDDILINANLLNSLTNIHNLYDKVLYSPIWEYSPEMESLLINKPFGRFRIQYDYKSIKGDGLAQLNSHKSLYVAETLASFCLSIKTRDFVFLGGMDENFPFAGCEDQEFSQRAKDYNYLLILDEGTKVYHNEVDRVSKKNWMIRQMTGVQGFVYFAGLHPSKKELLLWKENTPIKKTDSLKLKLKKGIKYILKKDLAIKIMDFFIVLFEFLKINDNFLFYLYKIESGIYLNKGFNIAFKKNARSTNNC